MPVALGNPSQSLAWSPGSRWLFVVAANGTLVAVDARTGRPLNPHLGLSGLSQIVMRPAGGSPRWPLRAPQVMMRMWY